MGVPYFKETLNTASLDTLLLKFSQKRACIKK